MILRCTLMNIVVDSLPQVLFAMHLYSPVWFLLMSMIFSSFSSVTWPVLRFSQNTFRGGVPAVTLHSFVTFLPSSTVTFCICSKATGTRRAEREKGVFQQWETKAFVKVHLGKHNSHEKKKKWMNNFEKPVDWSSVGDEICQIKPVLNSPWLYPFKVSVAKVWPHQLAYT